MALPDRDRENVRKEPHKKNTDQASLDQAEQLAREKAANRDKAAGLKPGWASEALANFVPRVVASMHHMLLLGAATVGMSASYQRKISISSSTFLTDTTTARQGGSTTSNVVFDTVNRKIPSKSTVTIVATILVPLASTHVELDRMEQWEDNHILG
ncbi:hypothetical protein BDU57DRAFT_528174 [Ampelomyces quisqualis]|uniref:Uncharacterized protein n=1 Tax=Ampelomyces quisqualis TaxID=50730 RepID=A0A6A5QQB2_AMPQU|nr:hypothetical protein BDU57DRAFT_528174 [Ampelomyces quisqualis]